MMQVARLKPMAGGSSREHVAPWPPMGGLPA